MQKNYTGSLKKGCVNFSAPALSFRNALDIVQDTIKLDRIEVKSAVSRQKKLQVSISISYREV